MKRLTEEALCRTREKIFGRAANVNSKSGEPLKLAPPLFS